MPRPITDFAKYRHQVAVYLKPKSLPGRRDSDIALNLPFELAAASNVTYRGKFLLIHGLNDSTYVWTDVAKALAARGFNVRAILLPGHGSHPQEMLDISYKSWLRTVRRHRDLWDVDDSPLYLGGFSLGGVIATIIALEDPGIAGLLLFSPAYHSQLNSLLRWSWLYGWFKPWMFGGLIIEDNPTKYNSIPINSGYQYFRTTQHLKKYWDEQKIDVPTLMVISTEDSVVDIEYTRSLLKHRFASADKSMLIYSQSPISELAPYEVVRNSVSKGLRILNQSHLSLMNAPDNPLLGEAGSQLICNGNEYQVFMNCMKATHHWFGAQHTASPDGVAVARTTYNPDFEFVMKVFDRIFIRTE